MRRFLALLILLAAAGLGFVLWSGTAWNQPGPEGAPVVLIAPHTPVRDIARLLESQGNVQNAYLFEFDLRVRGLNSRIKAGEYALPPRASMADIAGILVAGKSIQHKLTAAEGLTSQMIYKLVEADPVLTGAAGAVPGEGALLPETYLFTRGTTRAEILSRMKKAQAAFFDPRWAARNTALPFTTPREAVILASIVEKETARPDERRHIAAVFINRLRSGMRLQSDPTIIYGITQGYPLGRGIKESEIQAATPFNTYAIAGLPPTPICDPGKDSLAAVLDPLDSADLYFVADGTGGHVFAPTIEQHQKNVVRWRSIEQAAKAAAGK